MQIKAQILKIISGNEYIFIDKTTTIDNIEKADNFDQVNMDEPIPTGVLERMNITPPNISIEQSASTKNKPNIFISHGKNNSTIIEQLKELLE